MPTSGGGRYGLDGWPAYDVYVIDENVMNPGGIPGRAAEFWMDDYLIPVTPHTFKINNNNMNESDQLVDGTPLTIPKRDKAQSLSIEFMFPHYFYRFRDPYNCFLTSKFIHVKNLTDWLWNKKAAREPFVLTIIFVDGHKLNIRCMLDDYTYTQEAENGSDYNFSLTFTEYRETLNQELDVELKNTLSKHNIRSLRSVGGPTPTTPITYETVTGKHTMTWEEMKGQIEAWLKGEWGKISDKDYTNFDEIFRLWWESDEDRKQLHRPDTNTELKKWWIDFMQKSDAEQATNAKMAAIEAWLNHEVEQITEEPPTDFWEKFKFWWRNDPDRQQLHRPRDQAELFNWWDDFMEKSHQEQERNKTLGEIQAWLDNELKTFPDPKPEDFWARLKLWWDSDPSRKELHCPTSNEELLVWWADFMKLSQDEATLKAEIEAWLNVEVAKLTSSPPKTFKERLQLWWNSDETRKNTMHCPDSDAELLNWWRDFKKLNAENELRAKKMEEVRAWLKGVLDRDFNDTPDDFWVGFSIWWVSEDQRRYEHMPNTEQEVVEWWDKNKEELLKS